MCCALPDYDTNAWTASRAYPVYMGQQPLYHLEGIRKDAHRPAESPADVGCFAAWSRCAFVRSLDRYRRDRTEDGNRVAALFTTDDRFVLECLQALEREEDAAHAEFMDAVHKARMKALDSQRKAGR